jgi:hypothetical protein
VADAALPGCQHAPKFFIFSLGGKDFRYPFLQEDGLSGGKADGHWGKNSRYDLENEILLKLLKERIDSSDLLMVAYACDLSFSPCAPLPGGNGLGSLNSITIRCLGDQGKASPKIQGKLIFKANLCYHGLGEMIRLQEQNLEVFSPDQVAPKTNF